MKPKFKIGDIVVIGRTNSRTREIRPDDELLEFRIFKITGILHKNDKIQYQILNDAVYNEDRIIGKLQLT